MSSRMAGRSRGANQGPHLAAAGDEKGPPGDDAEHKRKS